VAITGASSGIGRALALSVPFEECTLLTVSRRPAPVGEWVQADLADPAAWSTVSECFMELAARPFGRAVLLHFAGTGAPHAPTAAAEFREYRSAVLLNAACGPVLGQAFIRACRRGDVPATVVLCSSPGAATPMPGMSHYGSGKLGMEYWVRAVSAEHAAEDRVRAFAVVPFAVDTPMVREVIAQPADAQPVASVLRDAAERGELASAEATAAEIWQLVVAGTEPGAVVPVGAVPAGPRGAAA
jgi:short-subunit dehydrogenase